MPRDGAFTLSDVRGPSLTIVCAPCGLARPSSRWKARARLPMRPATRLSPLMNSRRRRQFQERTSSRRVRTGRYRGTSLRYASVPLTFAQAVVEGERLPGDPTSIGVDDYPAEKHRNHHRHHGRTSSLFFNASCASCVASTAWLSAGPSPRPRAGETRARRPGRPVRRAANSSPTRPSRRLSGKSRSRPRRRR
jgi:hypothetical protein